MAAMTSCENTLLDIPVECNSRVYPNNTAVESNLFHEARESIGSRHIKLTLFFGHKASAHVNFDAFKRVLQRLSSNRNGWLTCLLWQPRVTKKCSISEKNSKSVTMTTKNYLKSRLLLGGSDF